MKETKQFIPQAGKGKLIAFLIPVAFLFVVVLLTLLNLLQYFTGRE